MMHDWNVVLIRYCDGGSYAGNNETVSHFHGSRLFFRGKRNREAVYASLLRTASLGKATDVVVSGCSAGGLAAYLHVDQYCDALAVDAPGVKCVGMPDSGFFLDYQDPRTPAGRGALGTLPGNYHRGLKWVFEAMNATAGVNADCIDAKRSGGPATDAPLYLCMFAEHTAPYTHTPVFALQSEYDSWQTGHVLHDPATAADVQALGNNLTRRLAADLFGPHPLSGGFVVLFARLGEAQCA